MYAMSKISKATFCYRREHESQNFVTFTISFPKKAFWWFGGAFGVLFVFFFGGFVSVCVGFCCFVLH